jgi:RHS repeat-associated protein
MTNGSGTIVWAADYKPFGEATITVSTITNSLRFPGQYFDAETGLNYNYFRDYNPAIGRYIESDPLLQRFFFKRRNFFLIPALATTPERLQPYSYVASNPVNLIDPLGLYHCVGGANCDFTPDMNTALQCFDTCTGRDNAITGGRSGRNTPNSSHSRGEACDIGRNSNPDLSRDDAERCTTQCFPNGYGQEERNGPNIPGTHFHIQLNTVPGGQPGFGDGIRGYQP